MVANARETFTESAVIDQFLAAMRALDIPVDEPIIADGKLHRYHVAGDRRRERNAWATLHIDARPAGEFGCNKRYTGQKFPWKMDVGRELTAEERREIKDISKARAKQRAAEEQIQHEQAAERALYLHSRAQQVDIHPYLTSKGVPSNPRLRVGSWYYIDEDTGEEVLIADDALLVPMMDFTGKIHSIQAIFSDNDGGFRKQFLKNGDIKGNFLSLAKPTNDIVLICEGLATGLSLWQCTGYAVLVAFNAGNLIHVARILRDVKPDFRIMVCADNDQWTDKPIKNPGIYHARLAAGAVAGTVVYPEFLVTETKPTDFNDLHQLEGEAAVRNTINSNLATAPKEAEEILLEAERERAELPPGTPPASGEGPSKNPHFAILGYDHETYFFFQFEKRQLISYTCAQMNDGGFIQLASVNWWQDKFPSASGGAGSIDKKQAMEFLMRTANKRGIFSTNNIRGRGAWYDNGRSVYHHGKYLTVDGERVDVTRIQSKYVYELGQDLDQPADRPLTDDEGFELLNLSTKFRWAMPGSAALLIGWITLAPLCGALKWRPHIWLTGNAGSGKSTVVESFVNGLLHGTALYAQGNSTEPGLRQRLKADALPIIIDESEQNEEKDVQRIQSILGLMRQSSTESQAMTYKGTTFGNAMYFHIRSMFCLSSIQVGVKHQADVERISVLTLKPAMSGPLAAQQWELLRERLYTMVGRDPEISARLFRRSLDMLPTILKNIEVFKSVAARLFKSQRTGDQFGTLLAGCFAMISKKEATPEDAEILINQYQWTEHIDDSDNDESQRALMGLLEAHIRAPGGVDLSVYEILSLAQDISRAGVSIEKDTAISLLGRYGMKIDGKYLLLSSGSNELRALMAQTTFKSDWYGILLRLPDADRNGNKPVRMNGILVKVIRINIEPIFAGDSRRVTQADIDDPPAPF